MNFRPVAIIVMCLRISSTSAGFESDAIWSTAKLWGQHCNDLLRPERKWRLARIQEDPLPHVISDSVSTPHRETEIFGGPLHSYYNPEARLIEVIEFANHMFRRRGWSEAFLQERIAIAKKYAEFSAYVRVKGKTYPNAGRTLGTLGVTVGPELPMESTHGWRITNPHKMELRTYAMLRGDHSDIFPDLFGGLVDIVAARVAKNPEILDQKILYTYGDEISIKLYGAMGFELADFREFPPKFHEGTHWKVLQISPRDLFENHRRVLGTHSLSSKKPVKLISSDGQELIASNVRTLRLAGDSVVTFTLAEKAKFMGNQWLPAGTEISMDPDGRMRAIFLSEGELEVLPGVRVGISGSGLNDHTAVKRSGDIWFNPDGSIKSMGPMAAPFEVLPGVWVPRGGNISSTSHPPTLILEDIFATRDEALRLAPELEIIIDPTPEQAFRRFKRFDRRPKTFFEMGKDGVFHRLK